MAESDTGSLPKVQFADKTDKPVELKSVAVELPPKEKKRVGRPKRVAEAKEKEKVTAESIVTEASKEMEKVADAPVLIASEEIKEAIPTIDNKEYIAQLHEEHKVLVQEKADLEYELQCMQANFQALDAARVTQLHKQAEGTVLAVHTSIIVGGIIGGACSAGALALIKMFL